MRPPPPTPGGGSPHALRPYVLGTLLPRRLHDDDRDGEDRLTTETLTPISMSGPRSFAPDPSVLFAVALFRYSPRERRE
jgi:hypothetical protein